jgi:hypothetical protein
VAAAVVEFTTYKYNVRAKQRALVFFLGLDFFLFCA